MTLSADAAAGTQAAEEARRALGLPLEKPLDDILATLERDAKLRVFVLPLGEEGIAGAYQMRRKRPWVLVNADQSVQRQRFTLAHEFGHHWLGHGAAYDKPDFVSDRSPREVQANYFAGAFLVPGAALDHALETFGRPPIDLDVVVGLAAYFGVSAAAMRVRLETLGRLQPQKIAEFDQRIQAKEHLFPSRLGATPITDSLVLAKNEGARVPAEMLVRALRAADAGLLDPERLPDVLHAPHAAIAAQRERELVTAD